MRRGFARLTFVVLALGFTAHLACGGGEPEGSSPIDGGDDRAADGAAPVPAPMPASTAAA